MKIFNIQKLKTEINSYPTSDFAQKFFIADGKYNLHQLEIDDPTYYEHVVGTLKIRDFSSIEYLLKVRQIIIKRFPDIAHTGLTLEQNIINEVNKRTDRILSLDLKKQRIEDKKKPINVINKYGINHHAYEFVSLTNEINKYYEINVNDIYGDIKRTETNKVLHQLGFNNDEILKAQKMPPIDSVESSLLLYFNTYTDHLSLYMNHWHYLTNNEFKNLKKNELTYMNTFSEIEESTVFKVIRKIYVLECENLIENGKIPFIVEW